MATGKINNGDKFNNWTVIEPATTALFFKCICICGTQREVRKDNLGNVKGCGCHRATPKTYKTRTKKTKVIKVQSVRTEKQPQQFINQTSEPEQNTVYIKNTRQQIEDRLEKQKLEKLLTDY